MSQNTQTNTADAHHLDMLARRAIATLQAVHPVVMPRWAKDGVLQVIADVTEMRRLIVGEGE